MSKREKENIHNALFSFYDQRLDSEVEKRENDYSSGSDEDLVNEEDILKPTSKSDKREAEGDEEGKEVTFVVGNLSRSKEIGSDKRFKWTVFVRCLDEAIDKVQFILHKTFKKGRFFTIRKPPFEHTNEGWGIFTVKCRVTFVDGSTKMILHFLEFPFDKCDGEWYYSKVSHYKIRISGIRQSSSPPEIKTEVNDVGSELNVGKRSEEYFKQKIISDPNKHVHYYDLGRYFYFEKKNVDSAVKCFHKALEENEKDDKSLCHLGGIEWYQKQNFEESKVILRNAMYINERNPHTFYNVGNVHLLHYLDLGSAIHYYNLAITYLNESDIMKSELRSNCYFNRALCYWKKDDLPNAYSDFLKSGESEESKTCMKFILEMLKNQYTKSVSINKSPAKAFREAFEIFRDIPCELFTVQEIGTLLSLFFKSYHRSRKKKRKEREFVRKLYTDFQDGLNHLFGSFIASKCPEYFFSISSSHFGKDQILEKCNELLLTSLLSSFNITREEVKMYLHSINFFQDLDFFVDFFRKEKNFYYFGEFTLENFGRSKVGNGVGIRFEVSSVKSRRLGFGGVFGRKDNMKELCQVRYVGEFKNFEYDGKTGELYESKTRNLVYDGGFKNGQYHGKGVLYRYIRSKKLNFVEYEGMFHEGMKHGKGEMLFDYKKGNRVRGVWKNDKFDKSSILESYNCPMIHYDEISEHLSASKIIGQGAYGVVYECMAYNIQNFSTQYPEETRVAVKIMNTSSRLEKVMVMKKLRRSIELFSRLKKSSTEKGEEEKHLLEILLLIEGYRQVGYVMPLCKYSIDSVIRASNGTMTIEEKIRIIHETAKGMRGLHSQNIMHRDLKWGNVLIGFDDVVQIADFDTLQEDESDFRVMLKTLTSRVGTPGFCAPEVFLGKKDTYSLKCDVFSFGLMIYSLLFEVVQPYVTQYACSCGDLVEKMIRNRSLSFHVAYHGFRPLMDPKQFARFPRYLVDLIFACWNEEPLKRPSFEGIVKVIDGEMRKKKCYCIVTLNVKPSSVDLLKEEEERKRKKMKMIEVSQDEQVDDAFPVISSLELESNRGQDEFNEEVAKKYFDGEEYEVGRKRLLDDIFEEMGEEEEEEYFREESEEEEEEGEEEEEDDEEEIIMDVESHMNKKKKKKIMKKKKTPSISDQSFEEEMLIVEPRYQRIIEWIEMKYETEVEDLQHHILGTIFTDEEVFKLIERESQPKLEVRIFGFSKVVKTRMERTMKMKMGGVHQLILSSNASTSGDEKSERMRLEIEELRKKVKELEKFKEEALEKIRLKDQKIYVLSTKDKK